MVTILKLEKSQFLQNYFDEICMAMHIGRFNPIGDQKFENLKIQSCGRWPS